MAQFSDTPQAPQSANGCDPHCLLPFPFSCYLGAWARSRWHLPVGTTVNGQEGPEQQGPPAGWVLHHQAGFTSSWVTHMTLLMC